MLVLSRADVEALLDPVALIDALGPAMAALSAGEGSVPPRNFAFADGGLLAAMPCYASGVLEAKLVAVFPANVDVDTHQALIAVFDPNSGVPLAVMDGAAITALRTAAGSALSTRLLARPDASVLAIVGTGVQSRSHARCLPLVREFTEIRVGGRSKAPMSIEQAVRGADVVCLCTHAHEPVIRREWLAPGAHVTSVGFTEGREVDEATVSDALVAVESRSAALNAFPDGANELAALTPEDVVEIGELVAGSRPGRTSHEQITLYKSVGVAVQDAVAASLVLAAARKRDVGVEVTMA